MTDTAITDRAAFDRIRYAQAWEDADVLTGAMGARPGGDLVSICASGDNALALLLCDPARVHAVDISPAQIECLNLRLGAYAALSHGEFLILMGARPGPGRAALLEQALRDSRVFAIYEGTTGMQGQDFFLRQTLGDGGKALEAFLGRARADCADHPAQAAVIEDFAAFMARAMAEPDREQQAAMADAAMRAGWVAVQAWLSTRIADTPEAAWFMATARAQLALHVAAASAPL